MAIAPAATGRLRTETDVPVPPPIVLVLSTVTAAVPLLIVRAWLPTVEMVEFVIVTVPVMLIRSTPTLVLFWTVSVSAVKPACVTTEEMPSRVAPVMVRPLTVLPSFSVTASLAAVAFVICGFVPAATRVLALTTRATPWPISC